MQSNRSRTCVLMCVPAEFSVYRWRHYKTPHYKTGTNWLCQIMGPLTKPAHVCLCVSVSLILNPDPKKFLPNHRTPLTWREGQNERGREKEKKRFCPMETFFLKCGSNGLTINGLNSKHSTTIFLLLRKKNSKKLKKTPPHSRTEGCFINTKRTC